MKKKIVYNKKTPYYNGEIIFSTRDSYGDIVVVENETLRTLHFDSSARQSAISLNDPEKLELSYCRSMLASFLFIPEPRSVLILGLGGGSLAKFMIERMDLPKVEAVELRQTVVQLAHDYFSLPKDTHLSINVTAAEEFLLRKKSEKYDIIFIDLFNSNGMASALLSENFFDHCRDKLNNKGVLSINLWSGGRSSEIEKIKSSLQKTFAEQIYFLPVPNKGNVIAILLNFQFCLLNRDMHQERANKLESKYEIEFVEFLNKLVNHH